ncbi:YybS family protein [Salipaludibacillus daqingensis]|uniref:YybS family protein n=1 Tax=Salipaludibacillus daqingensis TaxID=3041001 RepID=UPI002475ED9A|nr:YybS family protein [Salipaludibacillus daqingensis]
MEEETPNLIKEGAFYLGIYLLLMLMTLLIPVVGLISLFLLSIPFIFFTKKHGLKAGGSLGILAFFITFLILGPIALPLSLIFVVSGVVIGECYRRKKTAFGVLLGGALTYIAGFVLIYVGSIVLLDVNPIQEFQGAMLESTEVADEMMLMMGVEEGVVLESVEEFIDGLLVITPVLLIIIGVVFAFIVQFISAFLLKKKGYDIEKFPPLREWGFPKAFIWYYLFTYLIIMIGVEEGTALYTVTANLTPILYIVMAIQGFALVFYYFYQKRVNTAIPVIIVVISFLFPIFLHIVRILGIIDLGFDLRKRMNAQK